MKKLCYFAVVLYLVFQLGNCLEETALNDFEEKIVDQRNEVIRENSKAYNSTRSCPNCSRGYYCCRKKDTFDCCSNQLRETEDRILSNIIVHEKRQYGCPPNFHYQPASRKCYRLEMQRSEWEIARMRCQRRHSDAHLVVVDDATEQAAVVNYLKSIKDTDKLCVDLPNRVFVWAAGQRASPLRESTFVWKPNNYRWSEMAYMDWLPGEPNNNDGREECSELTIFPDLKWNDVSCIAHLCPLCEIDL